MLSILGLLIAIILHFQITQSSDLFFNTSRSTTNYSTMTYKHLAAGSAHPDFVPGKLRVYAMRFSPFAHRILLELEYKNIPYDVVYINLKNKPEWFSKYSPFGTVPAVEFENGEYLYDSQIIGEYLDEAYPEKKLYATDSFHKAKQHVYIDKFNKLQTFIFEMYQKDDFKFFEKFLSFFDEYNYHFKKFGKTYFGGDKPSIIDFFFWPIFERLEVFKFIKGDKYAIPYERFSHLFQWASAMKKEAAVKAFYLEPEVHAKFIKSELAGAPDFDFLFN